MSTFTDVVITDETVTEIITSGELGPSGRGVPAGGDVGEVLAKASATDFDLNWSSIATQEELDAETLARQDEDAIIAAALASHAAATTNAHGIPNTALLETIAGAIAKVNAHVAATDPHGDRAYADGLITTLLGGVPPGALDTVFELAAAIQGDEGVVSALTALVATKETPAGAQTKADTAQAAAIAAAVLLVDDLSGVTNPSTALTNLGVSAFIKTLLADADAATARATLGAQAAGTSVQRLNEGLLAWAYSSAFRLVSATRDGNEAITTASVVWPDGSTGTFTTDTASTLFPGAIDAYHVTYVPSSGPTLTITQTAVTRDTEGAVTAQPALVVT